MQALVYGAILLLIPNALFALWLVWLDLRDNATLTASGHRYVNTSLAFVGVVLMLALFGIVGYIETV